MSFSFSIVIPFYKEPLETIQAQIYDLENKVSGQEIIFCDGFGESSAQNFFLTLSNTKNTYIYHLSEKKYRSGTQNTGASKCSGDIILFLHVDTFLPQDVEKELYNFSLSKSTFGAFYKVFSPSSSLLKVNAWITNKRLSLFGYFLGDNAFFIQKEKFLSMGGFKEIALFEDTEISWRLRKKGVPYIIYSPVVTSSRKFQDMGITKTLIFMQLLKVGYFVGVPTKYLESLYRK